jgi:MSHA biogenesis protein MshG
MPHFTYRGRNSRGELVEGVLEGGSSGAIADQLFNTGITPVSIAETDSSGEAAGDGWLARLNAPAITLLDLILLCRQLYTLLKSGVPILRALAGLQASTPNRSVANVLKDLRDNLESGRELSQSMARHPKVFPQLFVSLVRVGEMTGRLEEVFLRLYHYFTFEKQIRDRIKSALRYPMFVMIAMIGAVVVINIFVIPAFAKLFASSNAVLPLPTRILIGTSNYFVTMWPLLLICTFAAVVAWQIYLSTTAGRYSWDRWKLHLPIAGSIIQKATLARFARSFALSSKSGVPIVQALSVVATVVDNSYMQLRIEQMRDGIERGESILRTAAASGVFNPVVLQMIAVGEETGEIDTLMQEIAEMYEREVEYEVEGLSASIEPILLVFLGVLVLILALGIFLPMWDMAGAARGGRR